MTDCILNVCLHIKLITGGPCFFSPHPRPMAFYGLRLRRHLPLNSSRKFGSIMLKYDVKTNIWHGKFVETKMSSRGFVYTHRLYAIRLRCLFALHYGS